MENRTFFVQKIKQRADAATVNFVVFTAYASDINKWVGIKRVGEIENGTQRILKSPRVAAIKRFLQANPLNTIPLSVVLAFNQGAVQFNDLTENLLGCLPGANVLNGTNNAIGFGTISFEFDPDGPDIERPALIVDGQHRIKGISSVVGEEIPIVVAAFIDADHQEQAFQFVVINNKAQKVPTDNVKAIISDIDETELKRRLLRAGVNYGKFSATLGDIDNLAESPFYHLLAWPLNEEANRKVPLTTIESSLKYIKSSFPVLDGEEDTLTSLFISIWAGIKETYPALWNENDKFMSKVNLSAINEFIVDKIEYVWLDENIDIYESSAILNYSKRVAAEIPADYWLRDWLYPLQDNAVVRGRIKDDLRKIPQNLRSGREWFEGLKNLTE
jgi:DGQHR domain-containing protein